jgi:hypothetical protein
VSARRVHLAIFLALAPLATACGSVGIPGGSSHGDPVANAATKTGTTTSMRLVFGGTISGPWAGETVSFAGHGIADTAAGSGRLHFRFNFPQAVRAALGSNPSMDMVFTSKPHLLMYMRSPLLAKVAPASRPWLKLDLTRYAAQKGIDLNGLSQMNQTDPSQNLKYLMAASKSRELGWDRVRDGTLTKHYALTINLRKLAKANSQLREAMKQLRGFATRVPAEAWVDDQGFLRKLALRFSLASSPDGPIRMKLSEEFYGFGVNAQIKAPPARLVTDASKLLNR